MNHENITQPLMEAHDNNNNNNPLRASLQQRQLKENSEEFRQSRLDRIPFFLRIARWLLNHFFFCRFFFTFTIVFVSSVVIYASYSSHDPDIGFLDAIFVSVSAMSGTGLASIDTGKFDIVSRTMFHFTITLGSVSFFGNCVSLLRAYVAENEQECRQLKVAGWGGHVLYAGAILIGSCLMAIENGWEYGFRAGDGAFGNCMFNAPPNIKEKKFTLFMAWLLTSTGICLFPLILRAWLRFLGILCRFECVKSRVDKKWIDALQDCLEAPSSQCHLFLFDPATTKFVVCYFTFVTMIQLIPLLCHQGMPFFQALAQTSGTRFSGLALLDFHDLNQGMLIIFYFVLYVPGVWVPRITQRVSHHHHHDHHHHEGTKKKQEKSNNNMMNINDDGNSRPSAAAAAAVAAVREVPVENSSEEGMRQRVPVIINDDDQHPVGPTTAMSANSSFTRRIRNGSTRSSTRVSVRKAIEVVDDQWYGMSYAGTDALQVVGDDAPSSSSDDDDKNSEGKSDHQEDDEESVTSWLRHHHHHKITTFSMLKKTFKILVLEDKLWLFVACMVIAGTEYSRNPSFPAQLYEFGVEVMGAYSGSGITMYGWGNNHAQYGGYSLSAVVCRFSQCVLILTMYSGAMRGFVFFRVPVPDESEVEIFQNMKK